MKTRISFRECSEAESKYFDEIENHRESKKHENKFNGSYEASKGDFEGAILARDEWNANPF